MPRRKSIKTQSSATSKKARRARRVPIIVIDDSTPVASPHVLNLRPTKHKAVDPLMRVQPVRSTPVRTRHINNTAPNISAFRKQAGDLSAEAFAITAKPKRAAQIAKRSTRPTPIQATDAKAPTVATTQPATQPDHKPKKSLDFAQAKALLRKRRAKKQRQRVQYIQTVYHQIAQTYKTLGILRKEVAIGFTILSLVFTMPIYAFTNYPELVKTKNAILNRGADAVVSLQETKGTIATGDLAQSGVLLFSALDSFEKAQQEIDSIGNISKALLRAVPVVGEKFSSGQHLLRAGEALTVVASQMLFAQQEAPDGYPTDKLAFWHERIEQIHPKIELAAQELANVHIDRLPEEIQSQVQTLTQAVEALRHDTALFIHNTPSIIDALGAQTTKRYLLVFQNSSELRATGGFVGSFGLLDVDRGEIANLEIAQGGSYDLQGQLDTHTEPPLPLYLVNNRWEFQDANWYPDFPSSAQNLMWFYEHAGGSSVDGVIAITDQFVEQLLGAVGGVTLEDGLQISENNFIETTSEKIASLRESGSEAPKAIIAQVASALIAQLHNPKLDQSLSLANVFTSALNHGDIQIYSTDLAFADTIRAFGWDGKLKETDRDYLHVNLSNIGGQKSDADLTGRIEHQAWIEPDGSVVNTVTVIRTHSGTSSDASNITYARFYVPKGSEMIDAVGFTFPQESQFHAPLSYTEPHPYLNNFEQEIGYDQASGTRETEEFGKTVFGNWVVTKPHQTSVARISYRLPFAAFNTEEVYHPLRQLGEKLNISASAFTYGLLIERQPGLRNMTVQSHVVVPPDWRAIWTTPEESTIQFSDGVKFEQPLTNDIFFGMIAEQK